MTRDSPVPPSPGRCPVCNAPVSPQVKFCESCGTKIEQYPVPVCRSCGALLEPNVKFCEACGVSTTEPVPPPKVFPSVTPPDAPVAAPLKSVERNTLVEPVSIVGPESQNLKKPEPVGVKAASPLSKKALIIAGVVGVLFVIAVLVFVVLPGFGGSSSGSGPTTTPLVPLGVTTSTPITPSQASATPSVSGVSSTVTPGPTQTLPPIYTLLFQVDKNSVNGDVTVIVTGPSRSVVKDIMVTLTRADGTVVTKHIIPDQKMNEVTLSGTRNSERVEVTVLFYSGMQYKVIDKMANFARRTG